MKSAWHKAHQGFDQDAQIAAVELHAQGKLCVISEDVQEELYLHECRWRNCNGLTSSWMRTILCQKVVGTMPPNSISCSHSHWFCSAQPQLLRLWYHYLKGGRKMEKKRGWRWGTTSGGGEVQEAGREEEVEAEAGVGSEAVDNKVLYCQVMGEKQINLWNQL